MQEYHNLTSISLKKFYSEPTFIDYRSQPRDHKRFPSFFQRLPLDSIEEINFIKNIGKVTHIKKYGKEEVRLRTTPSAGGLYPCEVYIQIRGIKGLLNGLYHYEPLHDSLTLLHELNSDGIEAYYENNHTQHQFIFLISVAYFRTAWKYDKRSIRYLLLDVGHQLAAIYCALKVAHRPISINFNFDKDALNELLCFEDFEFFLTSIISGQHKEKSTSKITNSFAHVSACDYQIRDELIEEFYKNSTTNHEDNYNFFDFFDEVNTEQLQKAIDARRSIRAFKQQSITQEEFDFISHEVLGFAQTLGIEIFIINNNIDGKKKGLYKNVTLLKEGDFKEISTKLALNQKLAGQSCATLLYTASSKTNYMSCSIFSGFLAHIIALKASIKKVDSSGIGAYFDYEAQSFLESSNNVLYLQVLGR